jgi:hypothetical protein
MSEKKSSVVAQLLSAGESAISSFAGPVQPFIPAPRVASSSPSPGVIASVVGVLVVVVAGLIYFIRSGKKNRRPTSRR